PEAALKTAEGPLTFQLLVQIFQQDSDDLNQRQDEGAKSQGASVVSGSAEGGEDRAGRDVVGLLEGPVVGREGPGQGHLSQRRHEVGAPEEQEDVVELQHDEVLVVAGLPAVEGKQALGVRRMGGGGERLTEREGDRENAQTH
uniref:Uncharacterized protein n=1 Tax=Esox lucius TaxID=8010 RepID=A0AAY5KJ95_ESOLU